MSIQDPQQDTAIAVLTERLKNLDEKMDYMVEKINKCNQKLDEDYVSKIEFNPVKKLYDKLVSFSLGAIFLIGGVGVAIVFFIKQRLFG